MNLSLPDTRPKKLTAAVETIATNGGLEERGAVFTKAGVVDAVLDLSGYTPDAKLETRRLLEPSFGNGDFLLSAIDRLVESFKRAKLPIEQAPAILADAIKAVELHCETFDGTVLRVTDSLIAHGLSPKAANKLAARWLVNDDFLLADLSGKFDFVIGNPPYVRQERIPAPLLAEYKRRFTTLYDRADLYILFYERGLDLLCAKGVLGFICANRWLKNKYGGPLRKKVADGFHLLAFIDLEHTDAFHTKVIAYPAITVIQREASNRTFIALGNRHSTAGLVDVVDEIRAAQNSKRTQLGSSITSVVNVTAGTNPWLLEAPGILRIVRALEARFPKLEDAGSKVGIGVATGADKVFIGNYDNLPVEDERKLRLSRGCDCTGDLLNWGGKGVVNPYLESGELASLDDFPRFAEYINTNEEALKRRHTAKVHPHKWYKTIDRIYPQNTKQPKLLIPDIKGEATVTYDEGLCYPHHNLYVVTSDSWDLRALQAVLRSSVALMFIAAYCVRMSGGFLRFQAQYLRRIRCPHWSEITTAQRRILVKAAGNPDQEVVDAAVFPLYGLSEDDATAICKYAESSKVRKANTGRRTIK